MLIPKLTGRKSKITGVAERRHSMRQLKLDSHAPGKGNGMVFIVDCCVTYTAFLTMLTTFEYPLRVKELSNLVV